MRPRTHKILCPLCPYTLDLPQTKFSFRKFGSSQSCSNKRCGRTGSMVEPKPVFAPDICPQPPLISNSILVQASEPRCIATANLIEFHGHSEHRRRLGRVHEQSLPLLVKQTVGEYLGQLGGTKRAGMTTDSLREYALRWIADEHQQESETNGHEPLRWPDNLRSERLDSVRVFHKAIRTFLDSLQDCLRQVTCHITLITVSLLVERLTTTAPAARFGATVHCRRVFGGMMPETDCGREQTKQGNH